MKYICSIVNEDRVIEVFKEFDLRSARIDFKTILSKYMSSEDCRSTNVTSSIKEHEFRAIDRLIDSIKIDRDNDELQSKYSSKLTKSYDDSSEWNIVVEVVE